MKLSPMAEERDGLDSVRLGESAAPRLIERATELGAPPPRLSPGPTVPPPR